MRNAESAIQILEFTGIITLVSAFFCPIVVPVLALLLGIGWTLLVLFLTRK